jgi:hypothetical protein
MTKYKKVLGKEDHDAMSVNDIVQDIAPGADLLEEAGITHFKVNKVVSDPGERYPYIVQQKLPEDAKVVKDLDKPMTGAQQNAVLDLFERLAEARLTSSFRH